MLPRIVGSGLATEIVAFDKPISSGQALAWGLVTKVVEDGKGAGGSVENGPIGRRFTPLLWLRKQLLIDSFHTPFGNSHLSGERQGLSSRAAHPRDGLGGIKRRFQRSGNRKFNLK